MWGRDRQQTCQQKVACPDRKPPAAGGERLCSIREAEKELDG